MKRITPICVIAVGLWFPAASLMADSNYYFGSGFSYRMMNAHRFKSEQRYVQRKRASHDLVLGYRTETAKAFYGPEINIERFLRGRMSDTTASTDCDAVQYTSYYCSRRTTYRLRGVYGRKLGQGLEIYIALGLGLMKGRGAAIENQTSLGINAGITMGLGLQYSVSPRGMIRGEVTHDNFNAVLKHPNSPNGITPSPSYEATTLKVSYILAF